MRLGLTCDDRVKIDRRDIVYHSDYHKHWYIIGICNQTANYITKKLFPDNYEGKFVNEAWICFNEVLTEFSRPEVMVRVEENKNFYYVPVLEDDLEFWMIDLLLPEINKINKLTEEEKDDHHLKNGPSSRKERF